MREIALDTETTGLDPASGHRVVEIGCVEMINRIRSGRHFHCYLNPERDMPREAFNVHGLSSEFLADKPLFADMAEGLLNFIGEDPLVIHNAEFDMRFINAELSAIGISPLPMERSIDTVRMARKQFPGAPAKLDALCKRFNIDLSARVKHGALLDAELLADVYLELTGGRQQRLVLSAELMGGASQAAAVMPARDFPPNIEELAAHQAFLSKIKNALWGE